MNEVVIVSGCRTAVGAFGGSLKNTSVVTLGASVMRETLRKAGLRPTASSGMLAVAPNKLKDQGLIDLEKKYAAWDTAATAITLDEVIMGNVLQSGQGQNTARQAMVQAGIAKETPAFTINKVCGSGLKAIALGAQSIMTGQAEIVLAGGQENMSMVPMALPKARWGYRMELTGVGEIYDLMVYDALYEIFYGYHMGSPPRPSPISTISAVPIRIGSPPSAMPGQCGASKTACSPKRSSLSRCAPAEKKCSLPQTSAPWRPPSKSWRN